MAPRLSRYQRNLIHGMLEAQIFSNTEIAAAARTTDRSIRSIRRNLRVFGQPTAPCLAKPGPTPVLTKTMVEALLYYLVEKPELYLDEMALFLWDEFRVIISLSTISRVLLDAGWSKKTVRGLISN